MQNAKGYNVIAQINLNTGVVPHVFELAETPKGLVEATIDGDELSFNEMKEMKEWLNAATSLPKDKE